MDFDFANSVYNYFLNKKEKKEEILFVVETEKQNYVVNRQIVAMMLVCPISPDEMLGSNYAEIKDEKTREKDNKQITYLSLSESGNEFDKTMDVEQRSNAFFIALQQLNNEENPRRYRQERKRITSYCHKNGIKSIDKTTIPAKKVESDREL